MNTHETAPNHHAHYGSFSGVSGLLAATSMIFGRTEDARLAYEICAVAPGARVLDIGCGPGAAARYAAGQGAAVIAVDPAPVMLRVARVLTRTTKIRYVEGTAEQLPIDDAAVAGAWSIATVHHWADIDAGLREVRRVLQPGGRFVAIERHSPADAHGLASHGWTRAQAEGFAAALREHGFTAVEIETSETKRKQVISVSVWSGVGSM